MAPESFRKLRESRVFWPVLGVAALLLFNLVFSERFFHLEIRDGRLYGTLVDVLNQGSKVMLLAIGMTFVIATGGVDLSVGSAMAISGAVGAVLVAGAGASFLAAFLAALGAGVAVGLANGVLVARAGVQPIVATLILMVLGRGVAMLITDGQIVTFENPAFVFLANGDFLGLPLTTTIVAAVFAATVLLARRTAVGLFIEATGNNETASRFSGVRIRQVKIAAYAYSGFCAGLAGLIAASNIKAADSSRVGEMMELDAIFAVVVGGTALTGGRFTLIGSLVGALLIQLLTATMINLGVPPAIAPVPKAALIIVVCLLQSERFRAHFARRAAAPADSGAR